MELELSYTVLSSQTDDMYCNIKHTYYCKHNDKAK